MLDVSIVNETSPEANWNRRAGGQTGRRAGKPMCREAAPPKMTERGKGTWQKMRDDNDKGGEEKQSFIVH